MGTPFIGEVRAFAFDYDPTGWLDCDGQLLPIMEYQPLFSMLGTSYGGNGETEFGVPKIAPLEASPPLSWRICAIGATPARS